MQHQAQKQSNKDCQAPSVNHLCYNLSFGVPLVNRRAPVVVQEWRHLHPALKMAQLPRQKEATLWLFPSAATAATKNEDRVLLQKPVFLGSTRRCWSCVHAKCSTLLHVSLAAAPQIATITRGGFPAISICPGIPKRPGVIRCYFRRFGTCSTRSYTRCADFHLVTSSFRPLESGPALKETGRLVTDRQAGVRDPCRTSTQAQGIGS
jgi:hypothetical protein